MPNRSTHTNLTIISAFAAFPIALIIDFPDFLAFGGGILGTLLINPDADLAQGLGGLGAAIGLEDYEREAPHRGGLRKSLWRAKGWGRCLIMSHFPIIGTLPRAILIMTPLWLFSLILGLPAQLIATRSVFFMLGMVYSDLWHIAADVLTTGFKEWRNGRKRV
jgi:uncharacterized metal-binding protein